MPATSLSELSTRAGGEVISTRLPQDVADALRQNAIRHDRTLAGEIRRALRLYTNDIDPAGNRAEVTTGARDGAHVAE